MAVEQQEGVGFVFVGVEAQLEEEASFDDPGEQHKAYAFVVGFDDGACEHVGLVFDAPEAAGLVFGLGEDRQAGVGVWLTGRVFGVLGVQEEVAFCREDQEALVLLEVAVEG